MVTAPGLLLAADEVELYPPAETADAHGWQLPGDDAEAAWCGTGNLQLNPGASDPMAADGGGRGPHAPAAVPSGVLFLPPGAPAGDGWCARVRGRLWVLSQVRELPDPAVPGGGIGCVAATATASGQGPDGGGPHG